jgi:hypothetical protein
MERKKPSILFMAEESAGSKTLTALARTGHHIVAVMTSAANEVPAPRIAASRWSLRL